MSPQFVKPYVKSNKNDAIDAEAICEAVQRPNMRFVPSKNRCVTRHTKLASHSQPTGCEENGTGQADSRVTFRVRYCHTQRHIQCAKTDSEHFRKCRK